MPVDIEELGNSRGGTDDVVDFRYYASGSNDPSEVRLAVIDYAITNVGYQWDGLQFGGMASIRAIDDDCTKWECVIRYGLANWAGTGAIGNATLVSFSTTGGTEHVLQSKETKAKYPSDAPDYKGAINVANGHPGGTEIRAPIFNFSIRQKYYAASSYDASSADLGFGSPVSQDLISAIRGCTAHTNDAPFSIRCISRYGDPDTGYAVLDLDFDEGELLLNGAEAPEQDDNGNLTITFHFSAGINRINGSPGEDLRIPLKFLAPDAKIDKRAWEYIWFTYRPQIDSDATALVARPSACYVERMYDPADFSQLGISSP